MPTPRTILVPTDFTDCSAKALAEALALAGALDAKVHLLHVYGIDGLPDDATLLTSAHATEEAAQQKLNELLRTLPSRSAVVEARARLGDPARTIVEVASELGVDLVVMGTHGRRGVTRLFLGSVAEAVLRSAPCTVMVVREGHPARG